MKPKYLNITDSEYRTLVILSRCNSTVLESMINRYGVTCQNRNTADGYLCFKEYVAECLLIEDLPIECLELDGKVYTALKRSNIDYIDEIKEKAFALSTIPNLGQKSIKHIVDQLNKLENGND